MCTRSTRFLDSVWCWLLHKRTPRRSKCLSSAPQRNKCPSLAAPNCFILVSWQGVIDFKWPITHPFTFTSKGSLSCDKLYFFIHGKILIDEWRTFAFERSGFHWHTLPGEFSPPPPIFKGRCPARDKGRPKSRRQRPTLPWPTLSARHFFSIFIYFYGHGFLWTFGFSLENLWVGSPPKGPLWHRLVNFMHFPLVSQWRFPSFFYDGFLILGVGPNRLPSSAQKNLCLAQNAQRAECQPNTVSTVFLVYPFEPLPLASLGQGVNLQKVGLQETVKSMMFTRTWP